MEETPSNLTPQELNARQQQLFNLLPRLDVEDLRDLVTVVAVLSNEVEGIKGPLFERLGMGDPLTIQVPKNTEAIRYFMEMQNQKEQTPVTPSTNGLLGRLGLDDLTDTVAVWDKLRRWWIPFLLLILLAVGYGEYWWLNGGIDAAHERRVDMARIEAMRDSVEHEQEMERMRLELAIEKARKDTVGIQVETLTMEVPETVSIESPE